MSFVTADSGDENLLHGGLRIEEPPAAARERNRGRPVFGADVLVPITQAFDDVVDACLSTDLARVVTSSLRRITRSQMPSALTSSICEPGPARCPSALRGRQCLVVVTDSRAILSLSQGECGLLDSTASISL